MITRVQSPLASGTVVRTTQPNLTKRQSWTDEAQERRKWGVQGTIVYDFGNFYRVVHTFDCTIGDYDLSELEVAEAPESYLDQRRPNLLEAMQLEGGELEEALASLRKKGYFTPPPGPWTLGSRDRGHGRVDCAVLDRFGDVVAEPVNRSTAELIIEAVNNHRK